MCLKQITNELHCRNACCWQKGDNENNERILWLLNQCFCSGEKAIKLSKQENEMCLVGAMFDVDEKQNANIDQNVCCNWEKKWLIANMNGMIELNMKWNWTKKKNSKHIRCCEICVEM